MADQDQQHDAEYHAHLISIARKQFIRETAQRLAATHAGWSPANYWQLAKELWDAKPEDC